MTQGVGVSPADEHFSAITGDSVGITPEFHFHTGDALLAGILHTIRIEIVPDEGADGNGIRQRCKRTTDGEITRTGPDFVVRSGRTRDRDFEDADRAVRSSGDVHAQESAADVGAGVDRLAPVVTGDVELAVGGIEFDVTCVHLAHASAGDGGHQLRQAGSGRRGEIDAEDLTVGAVHAVELVIVNVDA